MRAVATVLLGVLAVACAACGQKSKPQPGSDSPAPSGMPGGRPGGGPGGVQGGTPSGAPFLQGTKEVPARMEWTRDFGSRKGGVVAFRVTSSAPFGVTIVTDKGYQAIKTGNKAGVSRSDVLLTVDAKPPSYEGRVTVPPGMAWFIIENQSDAPATVRLECYEAK